MAEAVNATLSSVVGSSVTTVAGFIALCFMSFTLGKDLGVVMAKGVLLGVVGCVTTLPSLILVFDRVLQKTKHRSLIPGRHQAGPGRDEAFRMAAGDLCRFACSGAVRLPENQRSCLL